MSTLNSETFGRLAIEFGMSVERLGYWVSVLENDLLTGPFRHEPELIEETRWTPERADQFRDALIAALKDQ